MEQLNKAAVRALSERNLELLDNNWHEEGKIITRNSAVIDGRKIQLEYVAFHVGSPNQKILAPAYVEDKPEFTLGRVFFSTSFKDLEQYFQFGENSMVYFSDLGKVSGRVQKVYKHKTLFRDDIAEKIADYRQGKCLDKDVIDEIENWNRKYTIPFNPTRISRYKNSGDYVLLDSPVKVSIN
jgi:hypothetical protein